MATTFSCGYYSPFRDNYYSSFGSRTSRNRPAGNGFSDLGLQGFIKRHPNFKIQAHQLINFVVMNMEHVSFVFSTAKMNLVLDYKVIEDANTSRQGLTNILKSKFMSFVVLSANMFYFKAH